MTIKDQTTFLTFIISVIVCTVVYAEASKWIRVEGGSWQPSGKLISKIKRNLESHMKAQEKILGRSLKKWTTYHFQYQGQEEKGRKFVYINAFCDYDRGKNLSKAFVFVLDGGGCFFQLKYDPVSDKFFETFINGEA